jgi:outer membrane protein
VNAWETLVAARASADSLRAQIRANEVALEGVEREAIVGSRTTLDVLNAQQALVNARVALVTAQHDRVVASYAVLNAIGRLSPQVLKLATTTYDPSVHYQQVRDSWIGVRTPDGK